MRYEPPMIKSTDIRTVLSQLGPARAMTYGNPLGGGPDCTCGNATCGH